MGDGSGERAAEPAAELAALDDLAGRIERNATDERRLAQRIRRLRAGRAGGQPWAELLGPGGVGMVIALAGAIARRATVAGAALRRLLARGLRDEGRTVSSIAAELGVSHQRVSSVLRDPAQGDGEGRPTS